jgi:tripartite-type tricarboxylate transporter receptor subunit TctC
MKRFAVPGLFAMVLIAVTSAFGQTQPSRPIRIVVPFPPGGASDITARLIAEKFAASLGSNVVVDNRAGASGIIGIDIVAKAAPDGHTLGMATVSLAINASIHKLPYDTERDLVPITITTSVPLVLIITNNRPVRTVQELIDLARAKPDTLTFASSGTGTSPHLAAELFKLATGVRMTHIPYKGSAQAHPDLISGQVDLTFDTIVAITQLIKAGRVRALGVTSRRRSAEFPDVPTIAESVPGYEATSWGVLLAPAKLPPALIGNLNKEALRALSLPDVKDRLARLGAEPIGNTPDEARKFVHAEIEKWAKTVKAAGIQTGQ